MRFLRTNTAVRLTVGPFFDKTDGVTPETALTVTSCKLTLMVDDANVPTLVLDTAPTASGGANDMVHVTGDDAGFYDLELAAANVNYLGRAMLAITDAATHCPVFHEFMILPAMIYDSLVLGTDRLDTNVTHVGDTSQTAGDIIGDTNDIQGRLPAALGANGNIKADVRDLLGTAWLTPTTAGTPDVNTKTITDGIITAAKLAADAITAAKLAADVATEIQSGLATQASVNTIDDLLDTEIAAILAAVDTEVAAILADVGAVKAVTDQFVFGTANRVDAQVYGIENSAITAVAFATDSIDNNAILNDVISDIQSGLATQADQTTILAKLNGLCPVSGTIGATGNTTTTLHLAGLAYADDGINSMMLVIQDVSTGLYYARWIEDFANTGDLATVATLPFTPQASADLYWILPIRSDVTGGSGLDAAGVRAAIGLASANLDTQLGDLPTNAELATALGTADDAVLAAIAALNNLSQANIRTALGMASANLDTQLDALPTNAELATALGTADDAVLAAIAALNNLSQANIRTAVGLASANLDTQLAAMATAANLATLSAYVDTEVAAILAAVDTEIAAIKAKTDNLPTDPADASDIAASFASIASTLSTLAAYVDTEVAAIKAKTDSLTFTVAGQVDANAVAIDGSTTAADRLQRAAEAIAVATVGSGSTTTSIVTSAIDPSASVADQFKGRIVIFDKATTTAALRGQATDITASTSGGVLTVTALTTAPASGDTFTIT